MWLTFTRARHAFAVFVLSLYPEGKKMISGCTRHPILDADIFEKKKPNLLSPFAFSHIHAHVSNQIRFNSSYKPFAEMYNKII